MEDLKWCKNSDAPAVDGDDDWKTDSRSGRTLSCNTLDQKPQGQQIKKEGLEDHNVFNCFNRRDENPFRFLATKRNETTWLDWVNTPCEGDEKRRCLGERADYCIQSSGIDVFCICSQVPFEQKKNLTRF